MTTFAGQILLCFILLIVLHVSAMALMAMAFGVSVREVSFGQGKPIFTHGKVTVRAFPFGGFVRFKDSRTESIDAPSPTETADEFNHQPRVVQAIIPLAGVGALALVAALIQPATGISEIVSGFRQIVAGALGPLSTAQAYVQATYQLAASQGFLALLAVLAAKTAAFNLLPFPTMNGGQAILALLRSSRNGTPAWEERLTLILLWPLFAIMVAWAFSVVAFFVSGALQ